MHGEVRKNTPWIRVGKEATIEKEEEYVYSKKWVKHIFPKNFHTLFH